MCFSGMEWSLSQLQVSSLTLISLSSSYPERKHSRCCLAAFSGPGTILNTAMAMSLMTPRVAVSWNLASWGPSSSQKLVDTILALLDHSPYPGIAESTKPRGWAHRELVTQLPSYPAPFPQPIQLLFWNHSCKTHWRAGIHTQGRVVCKRQRSVCGGRRGEVACTFLKCVLEVVFQGLQVINFGAGVREERWAMILSNYELLPHSL